MGLKKLFQTFVFLVLLCAIILWLLKSKTEDYKTNTSANTVTRQTIEQTEPVKPIKTSPPILNLQPNDVVAKHKKLEQQDNNTALTYLNVYRLWRNFNNCQGVFSRLLEDQQADPLTEFTTRIQKQQKENNPHWPTAVQIRAVVEHDNTCQLLLSQIEGMGLISQSNGTNYKQIRDRLRQHLNQMSPKTPKELAIADVLSLSVSWQQSFNTVLEVSKGDSRTEQPEVRQIKTQMELLEHEKQQLTAIDREMRTQQDSDRIHEIWLTLRKLKQDIVKIRKVNMNDRTQAIAVFETINELLFEKLYSKDPDVFFEAQNSLEMSHNNHQTFGHSPYKNIGRGLVSLPFTEYISPGEVIKGLLGFQDNETFAVIINHATKIYHCELGADCGPKGHWNLMYCNIGYGYFHENACNTDLLSFYQDHYLSDNQWQDVQYVVDILRQTYAQR